jgi:hypothetical protein
MRYREIRWLLTGLLRKTNQVPSSASLPRSIAIQFSAVIAPIRGGGGVPPSEKLFKSEHAYGSASGGIQ